MSEAQESAQPQSYESPSIGEMLQGTSSSGGVSKAEPAPEPAPTASEAEPLAEAAPAPSAQPQPQATPETQPQAAPANPITPEMQAYLNAELQKRTQGILGALQAERTKRQELEQQLGGAVPVDHAEEYRRQQDRRILAMSERVARWAHPDYDEVISHFWQELPNNPSLVDNVLEAEVPAEAAYQTALSLKAAKEFGPEVVGNPYALIEKVRKKVEGEIETKLRKEYEAKLSAKAIERRQTPTDISEARAAGGGNQPYRSPAFTDLLRSAQKR